MVLAALGFDLGPIVKLIPRGALDFTRSLDSRGERWAPAMLFSVLVFSIPLSCLERAWVRLRSFSSS